MKVRPFKFEGIYKIDGKIATVNLIPGYRSANEELVKLGKVEYRIWDPWTSKPCAAFKKGLKHFPLKRGSKVLYLGFASGKTGSFFSDIVGKSGIIYAVEISGRVLREAIPMAEKRGNIVPILADARKVESYEYLVPEKVDLVYEDIADPDQIKILFWNCEKFLRKEGYAMIAIKSQSIDVTKPPREVYRNCLGELKKKFEIIDKVELDPFEKAHLFVVLRFSKR